MAEGHTIVRWAGWLQPLVGERLERVELPQRYTDRAAALAGQYVARIETKGKHLLLHLSGGDTIHCHAMMYGSWQVGKPGMELRKEGRFVRVRLRTAEHEAVFFHGPVAELLTPDELAEHETLKALGPDIMSPDFDRDEAWRRLQEAGHREIGDTVLDQRIIAGIGNVYKAEGLFLAGIHPQRRTDNVSRDEVEGLWDVLVPLMQDGVTNAPPIVTVPQELQEQGELNWVYRRRYKPCFRCEEKVQMVRQGEHERTTYFCPVCQPPDESAPVQPSLPELD
jgi:endonuclease-8